jgi:hypothetical protein
MTEFAVFLSFREGRDLLHFAGILRRCTTPLHDATTGRRYGAPLWGAANRAAAPGGDMALELRPNCERCDCDLLPSATNARICSYECTFCAACVDAHLHNVCPNCGGGFEPRPVRPATEWLPGVSLAKHPASTQRRRLTQPIADIGARRARIEAIPPSAR